MENYAVHKAVKDALRPIVENDERIDDAQLELEIPPQMLRNNPNLVQDIAGQVARELGKGSGPYDYEIEVTAEVPGQEDETGLEFEPDDESGNTEIVFENDISTNQHSREKELWQFGTFSFGFAGSAEAFGFGVSYSILYGFDDDGRKGVHNTFGYRGGPIPAASAAINLSWTDADSLFDLEGYSTGGGGSVDVGPSIGIDINTFIDSKGENRVIVDFTGGLGISLLAGEGHANLEYTDFLWKSEGDE